MAEPAEKIESREVAVVVPQKAELVAGGRVAPIIPRTVDEVGRVAMAIIHAGLAPDSYTGEDDNHTRSKIIIGIMKGAEVGLPPITALSSIAIINNRPCIWGDGAVALVQQSGKLAKMETAWSGAQGTDERTCTVSIWRVGQDSPYVGTFSITDAKRAKLTNKGPWISYPDRMLFNRARAFPLRDGFADCLAGLAIREEVDDMPPAPKPVPLGLLEDSPPPAARQEPQKAEILEDVTPSDWEVVAEELAKQYHDTFPADRTDFMTDNAKRLAEMEKADPAAHRHFRKLTVQEI